MRSSINSDKKINECLEVKLKMEVFGKRLSFLFIIHFEFNNYDKRIIKYDKRYIIDKNTIIVI